MIRGVLVEIEGVDEPRFAPQTRRKAGLKPGLYITRRRWRGELAATRSL